MNDNLKELCPECDFPFTQDQITKHYDREFDVVCENCGKEWEWYSHESPPNDSVIKDIEQYEMTNSWKQMSKEFGISIPESDDLEDYTYKGTIRGRRTNRKTIKEWGEVPQFLVGLGMMIFTILFISYFIRWTDWFALNPVVP